MNSTVHASRAVTSPKSPDDWFAKTLQLLPSAEQLKSRAPLFLAIGSATSVLFSNAVCQILLGAAILALIIKRERLRFPPLWIPLSLFVAGTVVSVALSSDPGAGFPQLK